MKNFFIILIIFSFTKFTSQWTHGKYFGLADQHARSYNMNMNVNVNNNVAAGIFNNSHVNMSNGGFGNFQANHKMARHFF